MHSVRLKTTFYTVWGFSLARSGLALGNSRSRWAFSTLKTLSAKLRVPFPLLAPPASISARSDCRQHTLDRSGRNGFTGQRDTFAAVLPVCDHADRDRRRLLSHFQKGYKNNQQKEACWC